MVVDHWSLPVSHQELDRSFAPQYCAACHSDKYQEWHGSEHFKGFSPGLVGQLMDYIRMRMHGVASPAMLL